jgi:hypothetical protein
MKNERRLPKIQIWPVAQVIRPEGSALERANRWENSVTPTAIPALGSSDAGKPGSDAE